MSKTKTPSNEKNNIQKAIHLDCTNFMKSYCKLENPTFKAFCSEWKQKEFHKIFSIIMSDVEMVHTTIEIFYICKKYLTQDRSDIEKICAMYLLYIIYFKQPARLFVKIECNIETYKLIDNFILSLNDKHKEVKFIYLRLISRNAFRFVQMETYYGLDRFLNKTHEYNEVAYHHLSIKDVVQEQVLNLTHETAGNLAAVKKLENNYNEMKRYINTDNMKTGERLDLSNFISQLTSGMQSIKKILNSQTSREILSKDEEDTSIKTKRVMLKNKSLAKMVENTNKRKYTKKEMEDESQKLRKKISDLTDKCVEKDEVKDKEKDKTSRKFGNRFDEINLLLTQNLPSDILKEFGEGCSKLF